MLFIVPPQILSFPQLVGQSFTNEQVNLTVTFQSYQNVTTTVSWFKNGIPISSTNITTRYGPAPNATTELCFEPITRENQGRYRVEIENTAEVIPDEMRTAVATFDVDVHGMFKNGIEELATVIIVLGIQISTNLSPQLS